MNAPEIAPYRGLSSYGESDLDALLFFGRARDVEIVVANLVASRLTVLYGPSGVGKSSLLRAGVARSLRELPEQPLVVVFARWGDDPSPALADAVSTAAGLPGGGGGLVDAVRHAAVNRDVYFILDQAEEYFLYHPETGAFEQELAELVAAPLRVDVLLSLREDALAKLDRFKALIPNILGNYLRLDRLDRRAGERAILGPLERLPSLGGPQVTIEPSLVERVLDEVAVGRISAGGAEPEPPSTNGSARIEAPFLQLVMQRLWEVEVGAGGTELRSETLDRLGSSSRIVADHLERALAALEPAQQDIASRLFNHLVTPSGAKIAQQAADLAEYAGVPEPEVEPVLGSLSEHRIVRRDDGGRFEIFHDVLAEAVLGWRVRHERERAVQHAREEARRRHRRRGLFALGALFACVLVGAAAIWAGIERGTARAEARRATARALEAHSATVLADDPELSLLLATEAASLVPGTAAEAALRSALQESKLRAVVRSSGPLIGAEPAGRGVFVTGGETGRALVARMRDGAVVGSFDQHAPITALAVSPAGDVALTGGKNGRAVLWSVPDGKPLHELAGAHKPITRVAFAPAGGLVLVASRDGAVRTYDAASGERIATLQHARPVRDAAFSADGRLVATTVEDSRIRIWNARTAQREHTVDQGGFALSVAFDPTGTYLASTGANRTLRVWDARTWALLYEKVEPSGRVVPVAFGPGGRLIADGQTDGLGAIRVARDGTLVGRMKHTNALTDVAFDPSGNRIATASTDRTARVWAAKDGSPLALLQGHGDTIETVRFSRDGRSLITASADGTARVWDVDNRPKLRVVALKGPALPTLVATSSDGRTTARAVGHKVVLTGPSGTYTLGQHRDDVESVAFSPDGSRLVTGSRDHDSIVFDVATGTLLHVLRIHSGPVTDAQFSPDSHWIVTAGPTSVGLWSAATGKLVDLLKGPEPLLTAVGFTPDGRGIVTRERNGDVRRADCVICGGVDELLPLARERLEATKRVLTDAERRLYVG